MKKKKNKFAVKDFDISLLPNTRKEQFFDILKNEWRTLLNIGLTLFIFILPFIALFIFKDIYLESYESIVSSIDFTTPEKIKFSITRMSVLLDAIKIVCYIIFSLGLAGVSRIFRCLALGEGFIFINDLFKGIKQNAKTFIQIGILFGLSMYLVELIYICLYSYLSVSSTAFLISCFVLAVIIFVLAPGFIFALAQAPLYSMKLSTYLSNGFKYSVGNYHVSLLFITIPLIPYITINIFGLNAILISIILFILFIFIMPIYLLSINQFSYQLFDNFYNIKFKKDFYKKGLYSYFLDKNDQ